MFNFYPMMNVTHRARHHRHIYGMVVRGPHFHNLREKKKKKPGYTKRVVGEGMPLSKSKDAEKGDLVISFDIVFPTKLEVHQKSLLKQALL